MTRLRFHLDRASLPTSADANEIPVWLYGSSPPAPHIGVVGHDLLTQFERLSVAPSPQAIDLVSISMAIAAADTFVLRDNAADGWSRDLEIVLPLADPKRWIPLTNSLEQILRFLSGDRWSFDFVAGGQRPPMPSQVRARRQVHDPSKADCVALFSGGLDSAIGALDLLTASRRPLLVSHAGHGDASYQDAIAGMLPSGWQRFTFNSYPSIGYDGDITTRTRSFQFLAVGALAAHALTQFKGTSRADLLICENGLIALNPPLSVRRIGAHSTRTAHPHYLEQMQRLFEAAGLAVELSNPYRHMTKGEMLLPHAVRQDASDFASATVSCGKWKRSHKQCGRCWPCIIRRASLHAAGIVDQTPYSTPQLAQALADENLRDDVLSVHAALKRRYERNLAAWVLQTGPLPTGANERAACFGVAERGMDEVEAYFRSQGLNV